MFGQVQDAPIPRHLHIQRKSWLESMLPIDVETKEIDVKLPRFAVGEDPKNRNIVFRKLMPYSSCSLAASAAAAC